MKISDIFENEIHSINKYDSLLYLLYVYDDKMQKLEGMEYSVERTQRIAKVSRQLDDIQTKIDRFPDNCLWPVTQDFLNDVVHCAHDEGNSMEWKPAQNGRFKISYNYDTHMDNWRHRFFIAIKDLYELIWDLKREGNKNIDIETFNRLCNWLWDRGTSY